MAFKIVLLACIASVAVASPQQFRINGGNVFNFDLLNGEINRETQTQETTTPIPILRSIDTQNPDGSYTYGYESGDGTYKIETRYATGEVKGKYGYFDDTGLYREVEYGAAPELGFMVQGDGLTFVAPQNTISDEKPVTSLPQQIFPPTPRPAVRQPSPSVRQERPILNERTRSSRRDPTLDFINNRGRKVTVVKRRRPAAQPKPQPIVRPRSQPLSVIAPSPAPVTAPVQKVIPQQQPIFQPQQPVFQPQQQFFQPQQRFLPVAQQQPIQPVSLATAFAGHPYINQFNPSNGVFSYNY
jgi:hypothetical protein